MSKYIVLLKFTEEGISRVEESMARAGDFRAAVEKVGAKVEGQYWTTGGYDGVLILSAPDEQTAAGIVLSLGKKSAVSTCMLQAFNEDEFKSVLGKMI